MVAPTHDALQQIPLDKIQPSKTNPRKTFDKESLAELAASIKAKGVLQPILVRPIPAECNIYVVKKRKGTLSEVLAPQADKDAPPWEVICTEVPKGEDPVACQWFEKADADAEAAKLNTYEGKRRATDHELVAGERRFRAAKLAGLVEIPAVVRDLNDREVLEIQVIENEQRSDLSPPEKAKGYQALLNEDYTIEDLAAKIGKAETTIRGLLKLLVLPKAAREAVEADKLPMSTAELIARVPNDKLREQCAKEILAGCPWGDNAGEPLSYRAAKEHISDRYMIELKQAPFSKERADLVPRAGACTTCPKLAGNNRDEFPDARADVCMDPACYQEKVKAHQANLLKIAKETGKKILSQKETKDLFNDYDGSLRYSAPYVDLAGTCHETGKAKGWKALVGKQLTDDVVVAVDPKGGIHELVPKPKALAILRKDHGVKSRETSDSASSAKWKREQAEQRKKQQIGKAAAVLALEHVAEFSQSTFGLINGWGPRAVEMVRSLVATLADYSWHDACRIVAARRGLDTKGDISKTLAKHAQTMAAPAAMSLFAELVAARVVGYWGASCYGGKPDAAEQAFYKVWGIDQARLKKTAQSEPKTKPHKNGKAAANVETMQCGKCKATFATTLPNDEHRVKCPSCSKPIQRCRECGCTENDCGPCIEVTGEPCHWAEPDLCSRCAPEKNGKARPSLRKAAQSALPSLEDTLAAESDADFLDEALRQVLEHYPDSKARWAEIAEQGASDEDLREAIGEAIGVGSTSMQTTDGTTILCRDKPELAIWVDALNYNGKPTIHGKYLVAHVRDLFAIPKPAKKRATAKA